jgi:DNA repair exonuclease SbcCD ATPase subunit
VRLRSLHVDGFGKLVDCAIEFDPRFNLVYGPNEAGKSTLTAAILATLYGFPRGERERWRPWSGTAFGTKLIYELADGRTFEVQRDFERDAKGVRVYDAAGNDASGECSVGRSVSPGFAHLGVPLEVFVNASFVAQGEMEIDGARAERISTALAQALDGGPREDAALGAIKRLDEALADHVGKKRATVNAPLRRLHEEIAEAEGRAGELRDRLHELEGVRERMQLETQRAAELEGTLREQERRGKALRAHTIRARLDALREIRDDLAALQAERALYADVDEFPSERIPELERLFQTWHTLDALMRSHAEEAAAARLTPALLDELAERRRDGAALDDAQFERLHAAAHDATEARDRATFAANEVQATRRTLDTGSGLSGAALASGVFVLLGAAVLAFFQDWALMAAVAAVALVLFFFAGVRIRQRREAVHKLARMEKAADDATAAERAAARKVAAILEPLHVPSIEEFGKRRQRARELIERKQAADRAAARAAETRAKAEAAARAFDALAGTLVPPQGTRQAQLAAAKYRAGRKSARDGIDVRLSMLDVRRSDVLGDDEEFALERELEELLAAGVVPAGLDGTVSSRAFEAERADLERRFHDARNAATASAAELRASEAQIGDLASLDERAQMLQAAAARLERFEAAVLLARQMIEERTREAHKKFARRLADYASRTISDVTAGRYNDVRIDPTTLAVRVRAPENGAIVDVDRLSEGTREQAYLVVRLAMARMFAEGLERPPLLLDDPFAYWDEVRIARSLPILEEGSRLTQTIVFTTSRQLVAAAESRGARIIDLTAAAASPSAP